MIGARRLAVVLGMLASFAVVVSIATILIMMALGFIANRANELDEERTRQAVFGALSSLRSSMVTTVRDYAVWDDAVQAIYGQADMPWLVSNFGLATEGAPLFDTVFLIDENGRTILAYRNGTPLEADARSYGGTVFADLYDKVTKAGLEPGEELGAFLRTPNGPAVAAVSAVRPMSDAVKAPAHALRLVRAYGTRARLILEGAKSAADLGRVFGSDLTEREVSYLMTYEWAVTAADVLWRRSKLGLRLTADEAAALDEHMTAARGTAALPAA